jgi:4-amino-4-deoxy-L-arabinose transferase-like glycosyltransferase
LNQDRSRKIVWIAAMAGAIGMRTVALGRWPGLNGDESWYGVNVQELLSGGTPFLHTGVGNPLNPFHSGLLLALSVIFEPSPQLLRAPSVILGMLAVLLAYPLLRGPLGRRAALLATVLLAISPVAIAYARLGWDPSGSPLFTLLAVAAALNDRPILALLSVGLGFLVHPTNVFVLPAVAGAWVPHAVRRYQQASSTTRLRAMRIGAAAMVIAIPLVAMALLRIANNPNTPLPSVRMVIERISSPTQWFNRAWQTVDLLIGVTSAADISAPMPPMAAAAATALLAITLLLGIGLGRTALRTNRHAHWFLAGVCVTFAGFHIVALPAALQPGLERYALFLLVPMLIGIAIIVDALMTMRAHGGRLAIGVLTATMLLTTIGGYFYPLAARGGESSITYRTGAVEPKLAAFRFIDADSQGGGTVNVIVEDWWLYWTLRYFAGADGRIHVDPAPTADIPGGIRPAGTAPRPLAPASRTYAVAFAGSAFPSTLTGSPAVFTAMDPMGRPILNVFRVEKRQ